MGDEYSYFVGYIGLGLSVCEMGWIVSKKWDQWPTLNLVTRNQIKLNNQFTFIYNYNMSINMLFAAWRISSADILKQDD